MLFLRDEESEEENQIQIRKKKNDKLNRRASCYILHKYRRKNCKSLHKHFRQHKILVRPFYLTKSDMRTQSSQKSAKLSFPIFSSRGRFRSHFTFPSHSSHINYRVREKSLNRDMGMHFISEIASHKTGPAKLQFSAKVSHRLSWKVYFAPSFHMLLKVDMYTQEHIYGKDDFGTFCPLFFSLLFYRPFFSPENLI